MLSVPINLLDLDTASKLSYWLKHLPYYRYYQSHFTNYSQIPKSTAISINPTELSLSQQIAAIFYENSLSGITIDTFTLSDYQSILHFYADSVDTKHEYIKYVYSIISHSQQYYKSNKTEIKMTETNQNWIINTYNTYVLTITQILHRISLKRIEIVAENESKQSYANVNPPKELYIKSPTDKWRKCTIVKVCENGQEWTVHYNGFHDRHDETVHCQSPRLSVAKPANVVPKRTKPKTVTLTLKRVWVRSASNIAIHRECEVIRESDTQYLVHWISYNSRHNCWIDKASERIKLDRPNGNALVKGDNLSCFNETYKLWLEVQVLKVNERKKKVKLGWVGSNALKSVWLSVTDKRLSITHKKHV